MHLDDEQRLDRRETALRRKLEHAVDRADATLSFWLDQFLQRLQSTPIRSIVFDLDGTLIDVNDRYDETPPPELIAELSRLAHLGITFAVATGRADGAQEFLRAAFPKLYWKNVIVGYSNGSDLRRLTDNKQIGEPIRLEGNVEQFVYLIEQALGPVVERLRISRSEFQVSIRLTEKALALCTTSIFRLAQECLAQSRLRAKVVTSSHSIDVISEASGKLQIDGVVDRDGALKIGDMGLWPGNDYEMLSHGLGLSVDQVSGSPFNCWNLLPANVRGLRGTLHYLSNLSPTTSAEVFWRDAAF